MAKRIPKEILRCPICFSEGFTYDKTVITCTSCGGIFKHIDDKIFFETLKPQDIRDPIDKIKYFFKKPPQLYEFLRFFMSPCVKGQTLRRFIREHVKNEKLICLNLGSGYRDISPYITIVTKE